MPWPQWVPMDSTLWKVENFREFLEARKSLLAAEVNKRLVESLHGETRWLEGPTPAVPAAVAASGGIISEQEEVELEALNEWTEQWSATRLKKARIPAC